MVNSKKNFFFVSQILKNKLKAIDFPYFSEDKKT